jgi:hypothetical protein
LPQKNAGDAPIAVDDTLVNPGEVPVRARPMIDRILALLAVSFLMLFQQVGDRNAIDGHPLNVAVYDLHIGHVHLAKDAVAQHGFLKPNRSLAFLFAVFVRRWTDMPERRAAYLRGRNFDVAQINIMEPCPAQVHIIETGSGHIHIMKLGAGEVGMLNKVLPTRDG